MNENPFPFEVKCLESGQIAVAGKRFLRGEPITHALFPPSDVLGWEITRALDDRILVLHSRLLRATYEFCSETGELRKLGDAASTKPAASEEAEQGEAGRYDPRLDPQLTWLKVPMCEIRERFELSRDIVFLADGSVVLRDVQFVDRQGIDFEFQGGTISAKRDAGRSKVLTLTFASPTSQDSLSQGEREVHFWFFFGSWHQAAHTEPAQPFVSKCRKLLAVSADYLLDPTIAVTLGVAAGTAIVLFA